MEAYNYEKQKWENGEAGRGLYREQLIEEIRAVRQIPNYLNLIGVNKTRTQAIVDLRNKIAMVGGL